jgi:hypothetical protein
MKLFRGAVEPPARRPLPNARTPKAGLRKSPSDSGKLQQDDGGELDSSRNSLDSVSGAEEGSEVSLSRENGGGGDDKSTEPVKGIAPRKLNIPERKVRILFRLSKFEVSHLNRLFNGVIIVNIAAFEFPQPNF